MPAFFNSSFWARDAIWAWMPLRTSVSIEKLSFDFSALSCSWSLCSSHYDNFQHHYYFSWWGVERAFVRCCPRFLDGHWRSTLELPSIGGCHHCHYRPYAPILCPFALSWPLLKRYTHYFLFHHPTIGINFSIVQVISLQSKRMVANCCRVLPS